MTKEIRLDKFVPREYQLPLITAIESGKFKRVLAILPRRAGKDVAAFNLMVRMSLRKVGVYYYIFPTFTQAKRVIWDSVLNNGQRFLDFIPKELIKGENSSELKISLINGSLIQLVGSDNYNCYDKDTQILTDAGWKHFDELQSHDKVASLVQGNLEFVKPTKIIEHDYAGMMYSIDSPYLNALTTPNHRWYVKNKVKWTHLFKESTQLAIYEDLIPVHAHWVGQEKETILGLKGEDFLTLLGLYLYSGHLEQGCITFKYLKKKSLKELLSVFWRNSIPYTLQNTHATITHSEFFEYVKPLGKLSERFIPSDIKSLSQEQLLVFVKIIQSADDHIKEGTHIYTVSKRLADDIQELLLKVGMTGIIHPPTLLTGYRIHDTHAHDAVYTISVDRVKYRTLYSKHGDTYISQRYYIGKIHCVTVPSGIIYVRRYGKGMWSGNSLMGTNPQGIVFSEYALQDPRAYQHLRPILTANDGWAAFISTPRGRNALWDLWCIAQDNPNWFSYKLTVEETKHIPLSEIEQERAEGIMSDDLIQQEYYCSFSLGVEGAYYAKYLDAMRLENRITEVPWDASHVVHTSWDLGVRDSTCIILFQVIGQSVRIIETYENSKVGLEHYVEFLNKKSYVYGRHIAPHDIRVQEFGSGLTRIEKARQLGIRFTVAPNLSVEDGIEAVRSTLGRIWIDVKCLSLIKALENYRQEYDPKKKIYKNHPLHDIHSHIADALRYLCVSLPKTKDGTSPEELEKRYRETVYGEQSSLPRFFRDV